ncbi:MAG: hypothetical protein KDN19_14945 [Verrucomicrobiae bacterium]|nr:hypothetical protein [Verrucomicrobiae bacterium]
MKSSRHALGTLRHPAAAVGAALWVVWLLASATTHASVTIEFVFGEIPNTSAGAIGVLVADRDGNGFTDLASPASENSPLVAGQLIRGSDDIILGVVRATTSSVWSGNTGFAETFSGIDYAALGVEPGDPLIFYWFPGIAGDPGSVFAGQEFFSFRSDTIGASGGNIAFAAPPDGGVYRISHLSTALGGDLDPNDLPASGESGGGFTPDHSDSIIARDLLKPGDLPLAPGETSVDYSEGLAGNYYGLIRTDDAGDDDIFLAGSLSGRLAHNRRSDSGMATFSFIYEGSSYRVRGGLESSGPTSFDFVKRDPTQTPMLLTVQPVATPSGLKIVGMLTGDGGSTRLDAFRRTFHPRLNPAPQAGRYTLALPRDENADHSIEPGGDGIGYGNLSAAGTMRTLFVLGDGTRTTSTLFLSPDGELMFYQSVYRRDASGWIGGTLSFRDVAGISVADGLLHWTKGADTRESLYPDGFDLQQTAIAAPFETPNSRSGERILAEIPDGESNAFFNLIGGNTAPIGGQSLTWDGRNRISADNTGADERLIVRAAANSGLVSGFYRNQATGQNLRFFGIAMQNQGLVVGNFVGDGESGAILIDAAGFATLFVERSASGASILPDGTVDFGAVGIDGGFTEIGVRIRNGGTGNLFLNSPPSLDQSADSFAFTAQAGGLIPPGESQVFRIRYDPSAAGIENAAVAFTTNDEALGTFTINLVGRGVPGSQGAGVEPMNGRPADSAFDLLSNANSTQVDYDADSQTGNYSGIVLNDAGTPVPSGFASLRVTHDRRTDTGSATGVIEIEGNRLRLRGPFLPDGTFDGTLFGRGSGDYQLTMRLAQVDGADTTTATSGGQFHLVGEIENLNTGDTFHFVATRYSWHPRLNASPYAGNYTVLLPHDDNLGAGFPGGTGAGTLSSATSGLVRLLVYLPDDSRLVWSGRVGDDGQINVYKTLDRARPDPSLIAGMLTFRDVLDISDLDGEFFWHRSPNSRSPVFAEGFEFRQPVIASLYTAPSRGEFALPNLIAASPNVELALTGNGGDESFFCDWDDRNRILYTPEDRELVRVNVNARSGLVTGFWFDRGNTNTRLNFCGALFQKQELGAGFWYFLDGQTGLMTLSPFDRPD